MESTYSSSTTSGSSAPTSGTPAPRTILDSTERASMARSLPEYRAVMQTFADRMGRDVMFSDPHIDGVAPELFRQHMEDATEAGLNDPFLVMFFSSPGRIMGVRGGVITRGIAEITDDDGSYREVMLDAHGITNMDMPVETLSRWARHANTSYLGVIDAQWLYDLAPDRRAAAEPIPGHFLFTDGVLIPWDLMHTYHAVPEIARVLDDVTAAYTPLASLTPEERRAKQEQERMEREAALREQRIAQLPEEIRRWSDSLGIAGLRQAREHSEAMAREVEANRTRYLQALHSAREAQATVEARRRMRHAVDPADINGLIGMLRNGSLTDVRMPDQLCMEVDTRPLVGFDERSGAYHRIGRMTINLNMETGRVRFRNLDYPRGPAEDHSYQAPHVFGDGTPCMGNFAEMVADMVARSDWFTFIQTAMQFAESVNLQDVGRHIHRWPFISNPEEYDLPPYEGHITPFGEPDYDPDDEPPEDYDDEEEEV